MELNYTELLEKANDPQFVNRVACETNENSFHKLSKEEIVQLLHHKIWKHVFITIFMEDTKLFCALFENECFDIILSLGDAEFFKRYITFTIRKNNHYYDNQLISFVGNNDILQDYLVKQDLLQDLIFYNVNFSKPIMNGISKNILYANFNDIFSYIAEYFPIQLGNMMDVVKEEENLYKLFQNNYNDYFMSFKEGQGRSLISFLNSTKFIQEQSKLVQMKEDYIIGVLFSSDVFIHYTNPYFDALKLLLKEILEMENATIQDIQYIGDGSFSSVYRIKDLVLKIGAPRKNKIIPSHKLILKPFFRRYLDEIDITVEVARYVKPIDDIEITKEIFFTLLADNIVWADPKTDNIGKVVPLENTNMEKLPNLIANESIGFLGNDDYDLEEGSYVILDTDYLIDRTSFEKFGHIDKLIKEYFEEYEEPRKK